eukprot:500848-Prorocentrum_minimum.AAC.1
MSNLSAYVRKARTVLRNVPHLDIASEPGVPRPRQPPPGPPPHQRAVRDPVRAPAVRQGVADGVPPRGGQARGLPLLRRGRPRGEPAPARPHGETRHNRNEQQHVGG